MEKVRLGKTNLMVSRIGFGGIPIQTPPEEYAVRLVKNSLDLGINFFDTSRVYTNSEERIGKALSYHREEAIIATKTVSRTAEKISEDLETSLQNLGTTYVDLYQFHNVSTEEDLKTVIAPGGPLDFVRQEKEKGKVRHIGITSHRLDVAKAAVRADCFETIMIALNFVNTEAAGELLLMAQKGDTGVIIMKPMAGGMLENPVLAFKYLMQFPDILLLVGIAKEGEMEENIRILENPAPISEADRREMDRIREELGTGFCRMCNYCQPCPQGIMISAIMYTRVALTRFDPERIFKGEWNKFMEKVPDCIDCGECEERCPYNLPIRERVKEAAETYAAAKKQYMEQQASKP
jgi:predicted aldo/keto reductase-like oxidoreductase